MLHDFNYTVPQMAVHFGCSKKLIYTRLYAVGLKQRNRYTNLTDAELDEQVQSLQSEYPNAGSVMMKGLLEAKNVHVQRKRLRESIERVNPVSVAQRFAKTVSRRQYSVEMSNSLWHIDGHMKLIRWGISTHAGIDGHSRLITFLHSDTDNKASTVLEHFIKACNQYGVPSRVRSDYGRENVSVALFINMMNGEERHSHIMGRSVHNQRIERLWRDVHSQVTEHFYNKFYQMEDEGELDPENNIHMFALQAIFVPGINKKLEHFREAWNSHQISTEHNKTPNQLWIDGVLSNINASSTPIRNIFRGPLPEVFKEKLRSHGIDPDSIQEEENHSEELLSQHQKDAMLAASQSIGDPVMQYKKCLEYIAGLGIEGRAGDSY